MKSLLDELWEKSNLTYISDLKGKFNDMHIKKAIKQLPFELHDMKEWKDVLTYLGGNVSELDTIDQIKSYIEKM